MSYLVIARKYRPQLFSQVIGQEHITETLKRAITRGRLAHAYLFAGPRGVGKTTTARILAKAVNCERAPVPEPCNECTSCREITDGVHLDVIEIDGASNRGIDDVRELRERVRYAPSRGKRKVYIIDEVHMLTPEAFNALLKTLEEPPAHALFILATTEPHKVPSTILSRCQRFDFRRIPLQEIVEYLRWITEKEGVKVDSRVLEPVARRAGGCLRDALSLLDQLIAYGVEEGSEGFDSRLVQDLLGVVDREVYFGMVNDLFHGRLGEVLSAVRELLNHGHDLVELTKGFIEFMEELILYKLGAEGLGGWGLDEEFGRKVKESLGDVAADDLLRACEFLGKAERDMTRSTQPDILFELTLVKISRMGKTVELGEIISRLETLAGEVEERQFIVQQAAKPKSPDLFSFSNNDSPGNSPPPAAEVPAKELNIETVRHYWEKFIESINGEKRSLGAFLELAEPLSLDGDVLTVRFAGENEFQKEQVEEPRNRMVVDKALEKFFGRPLHIRCIVSGGLGVPGREADEERTGGPGKGGESPVANDLLSKAVQLLDLEQL